MTPTSNLPKPNPSEAIPALLAVLEAETAQLEQARQKLDMKRQILVSGKALHLAPLDRELMALSRKSQELAREREALTQQLGTANEPLKAFISRLPAQHIPAFSRVREKLQRAAMDVERLNQENRDLLSLSLHWIQDTVEIIAASLAPESACYAPQKGKLGTKTAVESAQIHSTVNHSA